MWSLMYLKKFVLRSIRPLAAKILASKLQKSPLTYVAVSYGH